MKIGIYVDASNVSMSGGYSMRYDVLKEYCLKGQEPTRLNTYLAYDVERAREDYAYRDKQQNYFSILRSFGYKIIIKPLKRYYGENGDEFTKANVDLDMATDMLIQAKHLDKVYLLTGDGDFTKVVRALQDFGVRVELIAFKNISRDLTHECDAFTSGYIIPNLLPVEGQHFDDWGLLGTRVRGVCYEIQYKHSFGFFRYLDKDQNPKPAF
ncbi:MAG: NYN domain-containing protein, partial [Saprospiraceae bacterium]